jgi:hypothetical protein
MIKISDYYASSNNKLTFKSHNNTILFSAVSEDIISAPNNILRTNSKAYDIIETPFEIDAMTREKRGQFKPFYNQAALFSFSSEHQQYLYTTNATSELHTTNFFSTLFYGTNTWIYNVYALESHAIVSLRGDFDKDVLYHMNMKNGNYTKVFTDDRKAILPIVTLLNNSFLISKEENGVTSNWLYNPEQYVIEVIPDTAVSSFMLSPNQELYYVGQNGLYLLREHKFVRLPIAPPVISVVFGNQSMIVETHNALFTCISVECRFTEFSGLMTVGAFSNSDFYYVQNIDGDATLFRLSNTYVYFAANLQKQIPTSKITHTQMHYVKEQNRIVIVQLERSNNSQVEKVTLMAHDVGSFSTWIVDTLCDSQCLDADYLYGLESETIVRKQVGKNQYQLFRIQWVDPVPNYTPIIIGGSIMGVIAIALLAGAVFIQLYIKKKDSKEGYEAT